MTYVDKDERLDDAKIQVLDEFEFLHPIDRAEAFGELSEWAIHRRKVVERINDRDGVPDRSEDRPVLDEVVE